MVFFSSGRGAEVLCVAKCGGVIEVIKQSHVLKHSKEIVRFFAQFHSVSDCSVQNN